jgi:hypothetical protein
MRLMHSTFGLVLKNAWVPADTHVEGIGTTTSHD